MAGGPAEHTAAMRLPGGDGRPFTYSAHLATYTRDFIAPYSSNVWVKHAVFWHTKTLQQCCAAFCMMNGTRHDFCKDETWSGDLAAGKAGARPAKASRQMPLEAGHYHGSPAALPQKLCPWQGPYAEKTPLNDRLH